MQYLQGLLAALQLIKELVDGAKALAKFIQDNKDEAWFKESAATFAGWRKAMNGTPEEKKQAAERLRDLIRHLG